MAKISRSQRFEQIKNKLSEAKMEFEELRNELQDWLDNMPENLQEGEKANQLQQVIDELDDIINSTEELEGNKIDFPEMCT